MRFVHGEDLLEGMPSVCAVPRPPASWVNPGDGAAGVGGPLAPGSPVERPGPGRHGPWPAGCGTVTPEPHWWMTSSPLNGASGAHPARSLSGGEALVRPRLFRKKQFGAGMWAGFVCPGAQPAWKRSPRASIRRTQPSWATSASASIDAAAEGCGGLPVAWRRLGRQLGRLWGWPGARVTRARRDLGMALRQRSSHQCLGLAHAAAGNVRHRPLTCWPAARKPSGLNPGAAEVLVLGTGDCRGSGWRCRVLGHQRSRSIWPWCAGTPAAARHPARGRRDRSFRNPARRPSVSPCIGPLGDGGGGASVIRSG